MYQRILSELRSRPELQKAFRAVAYLGSESGLRILIGFFLHTWIARYLGPESFGEMNYIRQFVVFFWLIAALGLEDVYFKKLVVEKENFTNVVGDVLGLRVVSSVLAFLVFLGITLVQGKWDSLFWSVLLYGSSILLIPLQSFETVFLSQLSNRDVFQGRILGYSSGNVAKVAGILLKLGMPFFLLSYFLEDVVSKLVISTKYFLKYGFRKISFFSASQKGILMEAFPLYMIGLLYFADQRMGLYFLENYSTQTELGYYSVGMTLIELWYFLPTIIATSLFPKLIESKNLTEKVLENRTQYVFDICVWLAFGLVASVYILADHLIHFLYGDKYSGAVEVIKLSVIISIFMFYGIPRGKYLIIQNRNKLLSLLSSMSFLVNLAFLIFFKDQMNAKIVVMSSIFSFFVTNIVFSIFNEDIRKTTYMLLNTVTFPIRIFRRFTR